MHFRRLCFCWLAVHLISPLVVVAQETEAENKSAELPSVEALIERHIEALGGEMVLLSVESIHTRSSMVQIRGNQTWESVETWWTEDARVSRYSRKDGSTYVIGRSGDRYWRKNRDAPAHWLADDEVVTWKYISRNPGAAVQWRDFEGEINIVRIETVADVETYRVEFVHADGARITRWFDTESALVVQSSFPISGTYQIAMVSDFREVDGIQQPFKQNSTYQDHDIVSENKVEFIEFNGAIDASVFALPEELAEGKD